MSTRPTSRRQRAGTTVAIDTSFSNLGVLDELAARDTAIHRLDARAKLLTTLFFVVTVVSFDRFAITALVPFAVYPVFLASAGGVPFSYLARRILVVAPFAIMLGAFNPILDTNVRAHLGPLAVSGGWLSFGSILLRFVLTVSAVLALTAVSGFNAVCRALGQLLVPRVLVVQLMLLYRYIFVLGDEARRMARARALRNPSGARLGFRSWGSLVGHLMLRAFDRAHRIHQAMLCRAFDGDIRASSRSHFSASDALFTLGWCGVFVLLRLVDLPQWLGRIVMGFLA
ncbi:MAG: cobalt ECF transporter T component CbiQ [Planctomycetota bacterium]